MLDFFRVTVLEAFLTGDIAWPATGLLNPLLSILALLSNLESSSVVVGRMSLRLTPTKLLNCKARIAFLQDPMLQVRR